MHSLERQPFEAEMVADPTPTTREPRPQLSLFDCVCVIVGIIIGSGIYKTSPLIAGQTTGVTEALLNGPIFDQWSGAEAWLPVVVLLGTWLLGAGIALCGALCYAELASAYPHSGGDYIYLTKAFGKRVGFFFVWCEFWIVRPANIGAVAFVFSDYFLRLCNVPATPTSTIVVACLTVLGLTITNLLGVRSGIRTQNTLSVIKVLGLLVIFLVAFFVTPRAGFERVNYSAPSPNASFALAVVLIMFTLGGWNDLAFVSGEIKRPKRTILWGLVLGLASVTAIYMLVTIAFAHGLGFQGFVNAGEVASDLMDSRVGAWGDRFISALICISTLGAINGMLYAGARIYYALGKEHPTFAWVGVWNEKRGGPVRGLAAQTAMTIGLVIGFGLYQNGFERIVIFSTLFFWSFFLLVGITLFVLRYRDPDHPRPYRVFAYPIVPLLFCLSSVYVLYSSTNYALSQGGWEWAWGALVAIAGIYLARFDRHLNTPHKTPRKTSFWTKLSASLGRVILGVTLIATLASWTGRWTWPGELASNFVLHYSVAGLVATVLLVVGGRRWLCLFALLLTLINAGRVMEAQWGQPGQSSTGQAESDAQDIHVTIASMNLFVGNQNYEEVLELIRERSPDVLVCMEVDATWAEKLSDLDDYRFQTLEPREHAFGIALLSKTTYAARIVDFDQGQMPQILARFPINDEAGWYLGATHALPPGRPQSLEHRNRHLRDWSRELLEQAAPALMVGDFNATPWNPVMRDLLKGGEWSDSRRGYGYQATWPSRLQGVGIPIDHCLVTKEWAVASRETFAIPGSDHRGLWLELHLPNEAASN